VDFARPIHCWIRAGQTLHRCKCKIALDGKRPACQTDASRFSKFVAVWVRVVNPRSRSSRVALSTGSLVAAVEIKGEDLTIISRATVCGVLSAGLFCMAVQGQATGGGRPDLRKYHLRAGSLQPVYQTLVDALGLRLTEPGREHVVLRGLLTRGSSSSNLTVVAEYPNTFRIEETGSRSKILVFDGRELRSATAIDNEDEELAEMLGVDTAEVFLAHASRGSAIRHLGQRFRVESEMGFGSEVDIFEITAPVESRRTRAVRVKHIMFDSATGLLRRVSYSTFEKGQALRIETVYTNYSNVDGHRFPGEIRRLENGRESALFVRISAELKPAGPASIFEKP
jgi:hypothetical protein